MAEIECVKCPLCGATVPKAEIQKYGYCKVCRLLIEALTGQTAAAGVKVGATEQED